MIFKKRLILFLMLFSCFFILISSVSAANLTVNEDTSNKVITDWMKNDAKNGDSLIFNVSSYKLDNTLVVNKSINIKSDQNTKLVFDRNNRDMFNLTTNDIKFSGLNIEFNAKGSTKYKPTVIAVVGTTKRFDMVNVNITVSQSNAGAVGGDKAKGNIRDCNFVILKANSVGFSIGTWSGNIVNSNIIARGASSYGIAFRKWNGNLINSTVQSSGKGSIAVYAHTWNGKIEDSTISNTGKSMYDTGFVSVKSKGSIVRTTIKSSESYAVMVSDNVKVSSSSISSGKRFGKIYRYRPELVLSQPISVRGNTYTFRVFNNGYFASKKNHLGVSVRGKLVAKTPVRAIKAGKFTNVKVNIPSRFANSRFIKTAKVDYHNKVKEFFKKDNTVKFKF